MIGRQFPSTPKSAGGLREGDFWAVPLNDGSYACGQVVSFLDRGLPGARVSFVGGLLDWHGHDLPDANVIADAKFLRQGLMHILAITKTGGEVLGNCPLAAAGETHKLTGWGYNYIASLANQHFLRGVEA